MYTKEKKENRDQICSLALFLIDDHDSYHFVRKKFNYFLVLKKCCYFVLHPNMGSPNESKFLHRYSYLDSNMSCIYSFIIILVLSGVCNQV